MAKRMTDTDKWKKAFFDNLSMKMKLVWIYLCDNCDHAGIWDANFRIMSVLVGETVTKEELDKGFGDKLIWLSESKCFIASFVEFQYGELNEANRAHLSVIQKLKKEGAYKALVRPLQGAKDKEKDKEKDKVKEKEGDHGETKSAFVTDLNAEYLSKVSLDAQNAWAKTYDDKAWIISELNKAVVWMIANPKRAPKSDYSRFFNNWLSNGWERHRKTVPVNRYGKLEPTPIRYPDFKTVEAEQELTREPRADPEKIRAMRALMGKIGREVPDK